MWCEDAREAVADCKEFHVTEAWPSPVERVERIARPAEGGWVSKSFSQVPARWGVFALEDANTRTLNLVTSANVQRALRSRLCVAEGSESRADIRNAVERETTNFVSFATAGSEFEADLIYLSIARERTPDSYRMALDRWQAWFVHCDAGA
ncbi:MAG TPA: hypothetical protein VG711_04110, partial [Phycisphaerales bacterium]|nr:hypothetical protein [Phycisphaerales bacterium]